MIFFFYFYSVWNEMNMPYIEEHAAGCSREIAWKSKHVSLVNMTHRKPGQSY